MSWNEPMQADAGMKGVDYADDTPEAGVSRAFSELQMEMDRLEKVVAVLGERIDPVLVPSTPTDSGEKALDPSAGRTSQLASRIGVHADTIRGVCGRLDRLIKRVDL